jgi:hypothetical protein
MGTLHIYVRTRAGRTESMFAAPAGTRVVFHNTSVKGQLEVKIRRLKRGSTRLAQGKSRSRRFEEVILVRAKGEQDSAIICRARPGSTFKYSAQIGHSRPEDPIIWVPGRVA